jgi:hypothetical protein
MAISADWVLKRFEGLSQVRVDIEPFWRECLDYVQPASERSGVTVWDSTAWLALDRFASAMPAILTPHTQRWHGLVTGRKDLDEDSDVSLWLSELTDRLFRARYNPASGFAGQITRAYQSLGRMGTACLFIDDDPGQGIRYQSIPVEELYLDEDGAGRIDTVFRV